MKKTTLTYIVLLHLLVLAMLIGSDFTQRVSRKLGWHTPPPRVEITDYYNRILNYHKRSVDAVPDDAVIFIGDSITQGLCVAAVTPNSVNYGIGSDTTAGVLNRLPTYMPAIKRSNCVVIAIGVNDSHYRDVDEAIQNLEQCLAMIPDGVRVVVSAILPVDNDTRLGDWISEFNERLSKFPGVIFLGSDTILDVDQDGRLDAELQVGDGVHLNSKGNLLWAENLRSAIN